VDVRAAGAVRRDVAVFVTRSALCGFAVCLGASTETGGSVAAEPVGICDAAGATSRSVDKAATADGTTELGDNLMA
jgi:hypothetical protein